jgi:hypothetical protein
LRVLPVSFPRRRPATGIGLLLKGRKCPLQAEHLRAHAALVREIWTTAADRNPEIAAWLSRIDLVGYSEPVQRVSTWPRHRKAA